MLKGMRAILKDAPSILEEMGVGLFIWPFKAMGTWFGWVGGRIETSGPARFIKAIEPVVILIAIFAFIIEMSDRREERTARAWQLVITKASGNSGKVEAPQYLNSQDPEWLLGWWPYAKKRTSLAGIDLTPPALADQWQDKEESERTISWFDCPGRTYLAAVKLPKAAMSRAKLSCANLRAADLRAANLSEANLSGADLFGANLNEARLGAANLFGASFIGAVLRGAIFFGADLRGADLSGADLRGAYLIGGVKLRGANLSGTDLTGANFKYAKGGVDLSGSCADPVDPPINLPDNVKRPEVWVPWPCLSEEGN